MKYHLPNKSDRLCNYTTEHYRYILTEALNQGYKFCFFDENISEVSPLIFLRHDIDFTLEEAERICRIENSLGIKATYFILLDAITYSSLEQKQFSALEYIKNTGHKIGLHIEYRKGFHAYLEKNIGILETITGVKIKCFSLHNPSLEIINKVNGLDTKGIVNVYNKRLTEETTYISDSNQRNPCPCSFLKPEHKGNVQLLIHPIWWQENSNSCFHLINTFIGKKNKDMIEWFKENNNVYAAYEKSSYI